MLLKNLINNLKPELAVHKIRGISFDSRIIKKGDLFISILGNKFNGDKYIKHAVSNGATAVIHSRPLKKIKKIFYIKVKDARDTLAKISVKFFKKKPKNIVAVTGTNGKTSISDFFHQIFTLQNKKVGFLGTLGSKKNKKLETRNLTTLDPVRLSKDLSDMKKKGIDNVIIEASSHGLKQKRLNYLNIKAGVFTNLSHDHLDYHETMRDYLNSKLLLFNKILRKNGSIITDTDINQYKNLKKIQKKRKLKIFTIGSRSNCFKILRYKIHQNFQFLEIEYNKKIYKLRIYLYGSIQVKNLLMAILAAKVCGLKIEKIFKKIDKIRNVEGRLELVRTFPNQTKIFLDYAHTPDALEHAILSLKEHFKKKITVIFGCGGERDIKKRILMGRVANKHCDKIYVTDDNPRNENAKKIRNDIMKGLNRSIAKEIGNRKMAITYAIKNSSPQEIILVAGKGHETYQDLGKKRIFLSDKNIIKKSKFPSNFNNRNLNILKNNSKILKKVLTNNKNYLFDGVSINSKKIKDKNLFIAIKGKTNDGHNFLNEAIKNGASYCVISNKIKKKNKFIKVKNSMNLLNKLARSKRNFSLAKFIAITGSSGKTTVKNMLGGLLNIYSKTFSSPLSYNNHYGVPLSICNMNLYDNFGVFEIGMSRSNEIHKLSSLVKPSIGVITNISEAHLENFKNIRGIARAKGEIINNIEKDGAIVLNRDDKFFNYLSNIAKKKTVRIISFGYSKKADIKLKSIGKKRGSFIIKVSANKENIIFRTTNNNKNHIHNILCCVAILKELNLNLTKVKNFFKKQLLLKGRGKINKVKKFNKKFFLIDESYNANPHSVESAIENFSNIKKGDKRKYFLFGDMLELGKNSQLYHKKISKFINNSDIDKTFVYGNKSKETFKFLKVNKKGGIIKDLKSFDLKISKLLRNGDFLMIKGSNATKVHKISEKFLRGSTNAL